MIAETLPFSYGKPFTSPSEYLRINPNIFSKTKNLFPYPKKNLPSKAEPKIIRNVKNLPKHLIGRVHTDVHKGTKHKVHKWYMKDKELYITIKLTEQRFFNMITLLTI